MTIQRVPREPQTLMEAHEFVQRLRPAEDADVAAWRLFRLKSARVYERIADVDRGHHHEALYWCTREQSKAEKLAGKSLKDINHTG